MRASETQLHRVVKVHDMRLTQFCHLPSRLSASRSPIGDCLMLMRSEFICTALRSADRELTCTKRADSRRSQLRLSRMKPLEPLADSI